MENKELEIVGTTEEGSPVIIKSVEEFSSVDEFLKNTKDVQYVDIDSLSHAMSINEDDIERKTSDTIFTPGYGMRKTGSKTTKSLADYKKDRKKKNKAAKAARKKNR